MKTNQEPVMETIVRSPLLGNTKYHHHRKGKRNLHREKMNQNWGMDPPSRGSGEDWIIDEKDLNERRCHKIGYPEYDGGSQKDQKTPMSAQEDLEATLNEDSQWMQRNAMGQSDGPSSRNKELEEMGSQRSLLKDHEIFLMILSNQK
jgi:hypothetical protein